MCTHIHIYTHIHIHIYMYTPIYIYIYILLLEEDLTLRVWNLADPPESPSPGTLYPAL